MQLSPGNPVIDFSLPALDGKDWPDFLVDRDGIIRESFYGKDEGDHLAFEKINEFARQQNAELHSRQTSILSE